MKLEICLIVILLLLCSSITLLIKDQQLAKEDIEAEQIEFKFNERWEHKKAFYDLVEGIGTQVANETEWELHVYDCTDFSRELAKRLRAEGLDAYCVFGRWEIPDYKKHTWVEIDMGDFFVEVEATSGYIISDYYFKNYTIKSKGRCL